jgi:DNA-binding transcriptional ArsR family regulator
MVNYFLPASSPNLDSSFAALSDPTRRAILARLALGQATVTELAAPFPMSLPAVSKHLRILESAGLLQRQIDGRIHHCRLAAQPMKDAAAWIETYKSFWEAQFDSLAHYLEAQSPERVARKPVSAKIPRKRKKQHGRPSK